MIDKRNLRLLLQNASTRDNFSREEWLHKARNKHGHTYLHLALEDSFCRPYFRTLFEDLCGSWDDDTHTWDTGLTPYHLAVQRGYNECFEVMYRYCGEGDLNILEFQEGNTPLTLAAAKGNYGAAKIILGRAASSNMFDIDHTNSSGKTALDLAHDNGHQTIVDLINVYRENENNNAPVECTGPGLHERMQNLAKKFDHHGFRKLARNIRPRDEKFLKEMLKELLCSQNVSSELREASVYRMVMDIVDGAYRCGLNQLLSHKYEQGRTALLLAAKSGFMDIVCLLLTRGANIYDKDEDDCNILHLAADWVSEHALGFIIDMTNYQASRFIIQKDKNGMAPLHHAARSWESPCSTAEILMKSRLASLVEEDNDGKMPLWYAVKELIDDEAHHDFCNYQIEPIYRKSPTKARLEIFTDTNMNDTFVKCIFDRGRGDAIKWYFASVVRLMERGWLRKIWLPIKHDALESSKFTPPAIFMPGSHIHYRKLENGTLLETRT
ncbi:ankyrin repeat-containing domain protein [Aspergillus leporis]|uniref:Ankyrin repeat-containing domain protein n=1 Tax=Aspergillus leporis TaxID=41062 RepID=A0A5N5WHH6_9EURO|nr:ankyrin repeat-containing domain protein [Aspergillus leporis]